MISSGHYSASHPVHSRIVSQLFIKITFARQVQLKCCPYYLTFKKERKYAQMYARNCSLETWELKQKWRNIATGRGEKLLKTIGHRSPVN